MDKLDKYIASSQCFPEIKNTISYKDEQCEVLVFGGLDISIEIDKLLKKDNIKYINVANINEVNQDYPYKYLFAVDKDDLENLMVCSILEKLKPGVKKIAILNKKENRKVYEKYHIPFIYVDNLTALQMATELFPYLKR